MDLFYTLIFAKEMEVPLRLKHFIDNAMKILVNEHIWKDENMI